MPNRPEKVVEKKKKEKKQRIEKLRNDTENLIDELTGNSPVKNVLRKMDQRIQRLENKE